MRGAILEIASSENKPVSEIPTLTGVRDIKAKLAYFHYFGVIKEKFPPAFVRVGENFRRLTNFQNTADQNYLSKKRRIWAFDNPPQLPVYDAATQLKDVLERGHQGAPKMKVVFPECIASMSPKSEVCVVCELLDGLPIPPRNRSLEDILEFQQTREAELSAFWSAIEEIATQPEWMRSENPLKEINSQVISGFDEYARASEETWGKRVLDSASLKLTLDGGTVAAFATFKGLQQFFGLDPVTVALGALGAVRFSIELLPSTPPLSASASAMSYAHKVRVMK